MGSKPGDVLTGEVNEFLHLVLAVLAVVVLEVEVLGEEGVQFDCIEQVVEVDPLGTGLLIQLLLLYRAHHCLAVHPH